MKAKNIVGLVLVVVILVLMALMLSQESSKKVVIEEVKKEIKEEPKQVVKSEEEQYLEDLKKQAGAKKADYEVSKYYKTACSSCHGKAGEGTKVAPSIAGKTYTYIVEKLDDYRNDRVPNSLMKGLLNNISNEDLDSLAKEISNFK